MYVLQAPAPSPSRDATSHQHTTPDALRERRLHDQRPPTQAGVSLPSLSVSASPSAREAHPEGCVSLRLAPSDLDEKRNENRNDRRVFFPAFHIGHATRSRKSSAFFAPLTTATPEPRSSKLTQSQSASDWSPLTILIAEADGGVGGRWMHAKSCPEPRGAASRRVENPGDGASGQPVSPCRPSHSAASACESPPHR